VRQWVLSLPKRLRYFLHHDPELIGPVLRIFLATVEDRLKVRSPGAPAEARFGAVTFVHRFGAALNVNLHFHCAIMDGVFSAQGEKVQFHEAKLLSEEDLAAVQGEVRTRVLRLFKHRGLLSPEDAAELRQWGHGGGFSLDASVRIEARDRKGVERLLRYCARPIFAGERLVWARLGQRLIYQLPKPRPDGQTTLALTPLELLNRLAALIPPPRRHRHRYHGVLAPNAPLRGAVTARAGLPMVESRRDVTAPPSTAAAAKQSPETATAKTSRPPSRYLWAWLLARIYEVFPLICPQCGEPMRIIAFVTDGDAIQRILEHLGEPTQPPPIASARGPPGWEDFDQREAAVFGEVIPTYEFDQTVSC